MKADRDTLLGVGWIVATLAMITVIATPSYGPPFGGAFFEAFVRIIVLPGGVVVPWLIIWTLVLKRPLPLLRSAKIGTAWLLFLAVLCVVAWAGNSATDQFRSVVCDDKLPSLRVISHVQRTSYGDGSTWHFKVSLNEVDRGRLISELKLTRVPNRELLRDDDFRDSREQWLMRWDEYKRPSGAIYWSDDRTLLMQDPASELLYICRQPPVSVRQ